MTKQRLKPSIRKPEMLNAALILADKHGYTCVTRDQVADVVGVSGPTVQRVFGTMGKFRNDLMRHAIKQKHLRIIAQGLTMRNRFAIRADNDLKQQALKAISE